MSEAQVGLAGRGSQADYLLGTAEGWDAFQVVRWHAVEALSQPYQYEITLMRPATSGAVDLDALLDTAATFSIAAQNRWRSVHGILAEAEEIDRTTQIILYRVLLAPHFWHARYRRRCRNFVGKTLFDIVSAVLENRSPAHPEGLGGLSLSTGSATAQDVTPSFASFTPARATYRWDLKDEALVKDQARHPYVAQYNESDFTFVSRLLEAHGLSYVFEHGRDEVILAITDRPGVSPSFDAGDTFHLHRLNRSGAAVDTEIVRSFRDARRLRSRAVTVRDWDHNRSGGPLQAGVDGAQGDEDLSQHFEFPAGEERVASQPGMHAARVRIERYDAERAMREGSSTVRTMQPGYRFTLHDADGLLPDAKLLAVRVETFATQLRPEGTLLDEEPFGFTSSAGTAGAGNESRYQALSENVQFRPAATTSKPAINGVQTAVVTAEEYPDGDRPAINADSQARVRLRFPWDQRDDTGDRSPTSDWVRVSHYWAGAGYGALHHPRVGHEVIVAFLQGDPDRPIVVGRVYNATHPPPYDASQEPTKSTLKGQSAEAQQEVDGFNEIRFEDKAKQEEIYLHAQRNLDEVVLASHSTSVGGDQSNFVGHDQTNKVKGHREHTVDDYETVTVGDDRTTIFKANEHHSVAGFRDTSIGANEKLYVEGFRSTDVMANDDLFVSGWRNAFVGADTLKVAATRGVLVGTDYNVKVGGSYLSDADANHGFKSKNASFDESASFSVKAGSAKLSMSSGVITIDNGAGASISLFGAMIMVNAGSAVTVSAGGPAVVTAGGKVGIVSGAAMSMKSGGAMDLGAGGDINGKAPTIKWNG